LWEASIAGKATVVAPTPRSEARTIRRVSGVERRRPSRNLSFAIKGRCISCLLPLTIHIKPWVYSEGFFAARGIVPSLTIIGPDDPEVIRERYFGPGARIGRRPKKLRPDQPRVDRGYRNELIGLDRIEALIEEVQALARPTPTRGILDAVSLDEKTGNGALRMLDLQKQCHCRSGGRSQLLWRAGPRPEHLEPPRLLRAHQYELLIDVLRQSSEDWLATDYLMRQADFTLGESRKQRLGGRATRPDSNSARKHVLGALKVLLVLELVASAKYGRQAVVWQWIGGGRNHPVYDRTRSVARTGRKRQAHGWAPIVDPEADQTVADEDFGSGWSITHI
jgi:hypothetical protein